ncbi:hypothetical protein B0A54_17764 [Friedmanniomyces endolithicus]|uniref:Uncharacterized protein n=1 Tax=Friedmanniomyces endolithicus TaxID=329885 RepID=A0A4V5N3V2_9PEZI|nr:hypothetical protein B0A54_17764 [Friedmanniomyces endolithicus]
MIAATNLGAGPKREPGEFSFPGQSVMNMICHVRDSCEAYKQSKVRRPQQRRIQDKQTLSLTFKAPKRELSNITITIESNTDPVKIGQHLTFPDHEATSDFLGFPTCTAKICSPNSKGYAAIYG